MRIHVPFFALASLVLPLVACSGGSSNKTEEVPTGTASVALTQVPSTVKCVEIDVTGNPNVTRRFDVTGGATSALTMDGLPVGGVDIAGQAFDAPCSAVVGAAPTWTAPAVATVITLTAPAQITLTFTPATRGQITGDFESGRFRNVSTLAGAARQVGSVDGVGAAARFNRPQHLTADGAGNLYVADGRNKTIRKVVVATGAVTTIAGNPSATGAGVDGVGAAATFDHPEGITFDGAGNLFVTDSADNTVRKIVLATAAVTTIAGAPLQSGGADGVGGVARFNVPYGIASDRAGNLFVADAGNFTVRKIVAATATVTTLAGTATQSGSADGVGAAARFMGPVGIATDGSNVFVTDGSTLRMIAPAPTGPHVFTLAGDPTTQGAGDGTGGHLDGPYGLAFDTASGTLFIADAIAQTIRQYDPNTGILWTLAGSPNTVGGADGLGPAASFWLPLGITVDASGNLYVADTANDTIRKL